VQVDKVSVGWRTDFLRKKITGKKEFEETNFSET
jgi:hypothetical protein